MRFGRTVRHAALVALTVATAATTAIADTSIRFEGGAIASGAPVRGERTGQTLPYPSGRCVAVVPGVPAMETEVRVRDVRRIGTSLLGLPIWAEYHGPANPRAIVVVVAQVHGNECSPLLLTDRIRRHPPERVGIWLIPTINPDGFADDDRANSAGVDLNADGGRFSQPETIALRDFVAQVRPALTVHVHSPNGFMGAHPTGAPIATNTCRQIAAITALRCSGGGAGSRADPSRWFLWQGLRSLGGESLLVELMAVSDTEVPNARPRPATRSVAEVRGQAAAVVDTLDAAFG